ncbi:MAG: hypothetical protein LBE12_20995 [Planctomycetaceae bacterium]|nr:hypothetical protein [Planctomycetaceae bacterium]
MRLKPNGEYYFLITFRTNIYVAENPFSDFKFLWSNSNTSLTVTMAMSSSPYKLAVIVREYPYELPASFEDAVRIFQKDQKLKEKTAQEMKNCFEQGYEENIYLIDVTNGKSQKLVNLFKNKLTPDFWGLLNDKSMIWNSTGDKIITHDLNHIFSVDMSGNIANLYELKNSAIFSSLACDTDNNISFIVIEKGTGDTDTKIYDGASYLVQINNSGQEFKREKIFAPDTYRFKENNLSFVNDLFAASVRFKSKDSDNPVSYLGDMVLRIIPRNPAVPQQKPDKYGKEYLLHDPNKIQFYYSLQGYLPKSHEILFAKKRLLSSQYATPYKIDNAAVPWVELQKYPISSFPIK